MRSVATQPFWKVNVIIWLLLLTGSTYKTTAAPYSHGSSNWKPFCRSIRLSELIKL